MTPEMLTWLELVISLPTENATERMRVWRTLKATGAAVLRDGVYVLPERPNLEEVLAELAGEIGEAGGSAHVLRQRECSTPHWKPNLAVPRWNQLGRQRITCRTAKNPPYQVKYF